MSDFMHCTKEGAEMGKSKLLFIFIKENVQPTLPRSVFEGLFAVSVENIQINQW